MRRRRRHSLAAPEPLEAILDRAGESRFASDKARPPLPAGLWREAVGARIADRARPLSLIGGVLVLRVPSSVWAHELSLLSDQVLARLRERGVEARELRFRVGAVPVDRPPERRIARAVPPARPVPPEVASALGQMQDEELRALIARAASANLAWQVVARPAPPQPVSEARRAARAPRAAEEGSAPPAPARPASRGAAPRSPSVGRDRSR
jgi:hypothetical protein